MRKTRRSARKSRRMVYRRRHGGAAVMLSPAGLDYKMEAASLKQGQEFAAGTKAFHGGSGLILSPAPLDYKMEAPVGADMPVKAGPMGGSDMMAGPMDGPKDMIDAPPSMPMTGSMQGGAAPLADALNGAPLLPEGMHASARIAAMDKHCEEIKGMSDMAGGRRRRKGSRSAHRRSAKRSRKASRKARKASRKARKASRKARRSAKRSRKASRKGRRASRRTRQRGGAALTPADIGAEPMLLKDYSGAGLNAQWKEAVDPDANKPRAL
jgi:hypothetical protein